MPNDDTLRLAVRLAFARCRNVTQVAAAFALSYTQTWRILDLPRSRI